MSPTTCPNGHASESSDYCDTCGAPIGPEAGGNTPAGSSSGSGSGSGSGEANSAGMPFSSATTPAATRVIQPCPNCKLANSADALFCEACGYDFTTGTMPRPAASSNALDLSPGLAGPSVLQSAAPPAKVEWVAELWVDPDWHADQESEEPCPSPGLPVVIPLMTQSLLIGRRSASRNIRPDIECSSDVGVSRRQAQLTSDGQRWWVEDLQSSNGTYVGPASGPLPDDAVPPGQRRELAEDDRIYLGAWTRIVVRRATPEEQVGQA